MQNITVRVYYEDTDLGGVVYYANYLRFIERGRTEALRTLGIDQRDLKAEGRVFVVRRLGAEYRAPARFDDLLEVRTRLADLRGASCALAQEVWRGDRLLFTADVTLACMDLEGRVHRLPAAVREALAKL